MDDFKSLNPISVYSTKQVVHDGFLIQVDQQTSKEAGILHPVYLTRAVWDKYVEVPRERKGVRTRTAGYGMYCSCLLFLPERNLLPTCFFKLLVQILDAGDWEQNEKVADRSNRLLREVTLKALITARDFDDPSPAIFIMKPFKD